MGNSRPRSVVAWLVVVVAACGEGAGGLPSLGRSSPQPLTGSTCVKVCHAGASLQTDGNGLAAHLEHGDTAGNCVFTAAMVWDSTGREGGPLNRIAAAGFDLAADQLPIEAREYVEKPGGWGMPYPDREQLLRRAACESDIVLTVGFDYETFVGTVAADFPDTRFVLLDGFALGPNILYHFFAVEQGAFLVGAAAALKTQTGVVGFIGGVDFFLIHYFEAGFVAGARHIAPEIDVLVDYLTAPPDFSGFGDPTAAQVAAAQMYGGGGADVVFHSAGASGAGLFQAAREASSGGGHRWAIGVDGDQYLDAPADVQPYILTSMLKRYDVAVFDSIKAAYDGSFVAGLRFMDAAANAFGFSTSGGFVDDIADTLNELNAKIASGEIAVPYLR